MATKQEFTGIKGIKWIEPELQGNYAGVEIQREFCGNYLGIKRELREFRPEPRGN